MGRYIPTEDALAAKEYNPDDNLSDMTSSRRCNALHG